MSTSLHLSYNWSIDIPDRSNSAGDDPAIAQTPSIEKDGFVFKLKYIKTESSKIELHLVDLPSELAAIQINYSLHSPDILFRKTGQGFN